MSRKSARSHSFKIIFMLDFFELEDNKKILENYLNRFAHKEFNNQERKIMCEEFFGIIKNLNEIDNLIKKYSKWSLDRLNKIDLALVRLGIYELLYESREHIVIMNELANLANEYGDNTSSNFVNGIMKQIIAELNSGEIKINV